MAKTLSGIVKFFNPDKGYGFISREGFDDIFVHASEIRGAGPRILNKGDHVSFDIGEGRKGPAAVNVRVQLPG